MILAEQQHDWFQSLLNQDAVHDTSNDKNDTRGWFLQRRNNARHKVTRQPIISRKQEEWRYNRINKLFEKKFNLLFHDFNTNQVDIRHYLIPDFDTHRIVIVNGCYVEKWSTVHNSPEIIVSSLRHTFDKIPQQVINWFNEIDKTRNDPFSVLNTALINDGIAIHINAQIELSKPVEIIYINTSNSSHISSTHISNTMNNTDNKSLMTQTQNIISLGAGAKITLVERFIGDEQCQYFHNNLSEILLDKGASLKHYRIQEESVQAFHLSNVSISQKQNSHYHSCYIALGGIWSKTNINVKFKEEDAECLINGLYMAGNQQLIDFHLDIRHSVPACTSREQFKGILYGKGHAVFDGHILVEKYAQHTDAQLSNNNLILTRGAEVDTKPQLEIYADDVKCGHGTSIGQIDPEQLFYMLSRGLSQTNAYKLLCLGFAGEIIDSIDETIIAEYVSNKLTRILNQNVLQ